MDMETNERLKSLEERVRQLEGVVWGLADVQTAVTTLGNHIQELVGYVTTSQANISAQSAGTKEA